MPHPERPLRNNSWPGQLKGMQERGGQERMRLDTSPSSSSHAVAPSGKESTQVCQSKKHDKKNIQHHAVQDHHHGTGLVLNAIWIILMDEHSTMGVAFLLTDTSLIL
jgi:hypothetical protein